MFDHVGSQFGYGEPGQFRRNALEFEEVPYKVRAARTETGSSGNSLEVPWSLVAKPYT